MGSAASYVNSQFSKTWRFRLNSALGIKTLRRNPEGWNGLTLGLTRDDDYESVFRTFSSELSYTAASLIEEPTSTIKSSFDYMRALENLEGILATCDLIVDKVNSKTGLYTNILTAKHDFTKYKESTQFKKEASVTITDSTFHERLRAKEDNDIPYDRDKDIDGETIAVGTYEDITLKGREFFTEAKGEIYDEDATSSENTYRFTDITPSNSDYLLRINFDNVELLPNYQNITKRGVTLNVGAGSFNVTSLDAFYYADNITAKISYDINVNLNTVSTSGSRAGFLVLWKIKFTEDGDFDSYIGIVQEQDLGIVFSGTITGSTELENREGLILTISPPGEGAFVQGNTNINVSAISSLEATPCKVVLPHELFTQCVLGITGTPNFRSNYFGRTDLGYAEDGEGAFVSVTNGRLIRQFQTGYIEDDDMVAEEKPAQLIFRFKEAFDSYAKLKGLAMRIVEEDDGSYWIEIEKKEDLYSNNVALTLTSKDIKDKTYERERYKDHFYGDIDVGYAIEADNIDGGLSEWCSSSKFTTKLSTVKNTLDRKISYLASTVPIEKQRRLPADSTATKEGANDNNNFFIDLYNDPVLGLVQRESQGFSEVNGLTNIDTYLNLMLTPKQILITSGFDLNVGLAKYPSSKIIYDSSKKTTAFNWKYTGDDTLYTESADEIAGSLENPLFSGNIVKFDAPLSIENFLLIRSDTTKQIKYWNPIDQEYNYGWIIEVSTEPVSSDTNWEILEANPPNVGTVTLLATDTDALIVTDIEEAIQI